MKNKRILYGRVNINKLDWLLAISCGTFALAAIWLGIGLCLRAAGAATFPAFVDFCHALAFKFSPNYGPVAITVVLCVLFYCGVVLLVVGSVCLARKSRRERIPGLVAAFVADLGFILLLALIYELSAGASKDAIAPFWVYSSILFLVVIFACMVLGIYGALSNCNIEFASKTVDEVKTVVKEVKVEKQVTVYKETEVEEEPEEETEDDEEGSPFGGLGGRKPRVPFVQRLKKAPKDVREYYETLKKVLEEYAITDRFSIPGETFSFKREKLVFITFAGSTLKVYFAIDPKEFVGSTIPVKSAADVKRFEDTPSYLRIKSNLATRRAIHLVRRICTERRVPRK